jgi:hypothetical protein
METDYQRIRRILAEQFEAAVKHRNIASARFDEVRKDIPSGLPHPDGTQRIANASAEYVAALRDVGRAVQRIADFQTRGIVPDDLKDMNKGSDGLPFASK